MPFAVLTFGFFACACVMRLTKWSVVSWIFLMQLFVIMFRPEMGSREFTLAELMSCVADVYDLNYQGSTFLVVLPPPPPTT